MSGIRFSFKTRPQHTDWAAFRDMWREADRIPTYQAGWTFDHFYPISGDPAGPCLEAWTSLAALAAEVKRIRLGVMVTCNTYRHPAVLANMVATLDVISQGRLEFGIGAGWYEEEHQAYGIPFPSLRERFGRLEEACRILHDLLTNDVASFQGTYYQLDEARCEPKPIQRPRPPLVIGGTGGQTLRIAARWADQWNFPGGPVEEFRRKLEVLRSHCTAEGRDPHQIEASVQVEMSSPSQTAEAAASYLAAGADHIIVWFSSPFRPGQLAPVAEALERIRH
jgi:F420-dependent oxidoreductase-like protein